MLTRWSRPSPSSRPRTCLIIRRKAAALCLSTGAAFLIALPANGATTTGNLGAGASVAANCSIATAAVAFGPYDPVVANAAAALTATGSITVACSEASIPTLKWLARRAVP